MYIHSEDEKEKTRGVPQKLLRISQDIGVMHCVLSLMVLKKSKIDVFGKFLSSLLHTCCIVLIF